MDTKNYMFDAEIIIIFQTEESDKKVEDIRQKAHNFFGPTCHTLGIIMTDSLYSQYEDEYCETASRHQPVLSLHLMLKLRSLTDAACYISVFRSLCELWSRRLRGDIVSVGYTPKG